MEEKQLSMGEIVQMVENGKTPPNIKKIDDTPEGGTNIFPKEEDSNKPQKPWIKSNSDNKLDFLN